RPAPARRQGRTARAFSCLPPCTQNLATHVPRRISRQITRGLRAQCTDHLTPLSRLAHGPDRQSRSRADPNAEPIRGRDLTTKLCFFAVDLRTLLTTTPAALHERELDELKLLLPTYTERGPTTREENAPVHHAEREIARDELQLFRMEKIADLTE